MLSGWRTLLLPEAATAPRCSKESDENWRNVAAVARGDGLAQRHAALDGRRGTGVRFESYPLTQSTVMRGDATVDSVGMLHPRLGVAPAPPPS